MLINAQGHIKLTDFGLSTLKTGENEIGMMPGTTSATVTHVSIFQYPPLHFAFSNMKQNNLVPHESFANTINRSIGTVFYPQTKRH